MISKFDEDTPTYIIHHLNGIYYLIFFIPILCIIFSLGLTFTVFNRDISYLPFLTDLIIFNPEKKIISIFMIFQMILIFFLTWIREKSLIIIKRTNFKISNFKFLILKFLYLFSTIIGLIGCIYFTSFSKDNESFLHIFSIHIFFIFFCIQIIIFDYLIKKLGYKISDLSNSLKIAYITSFIGFILIRYYINDGTESTKFTGSSLFGYISFFCLFFKIYYSKEDLNLIGIKISKRI